MTQIRAHRVLLTFLQRAHSDGLTFVLVITGKGKVGGEEAERGGLRRRVRQWVSWPGFRSRGGGFGQPCRPWRRGALYVRVRRVRS
jgi:DNA-nicking Smr family endonuclease